MKILLVGEASFLHNTLKKGLQERGHTVVTMSDGNGWHDAPRDIDLRRDRKWGKLGGLKVLWQIARHLPQLVGNDIVQIHNYQFVPLKYGWNKLLFFFLRLLNKKTVKGCFGDDPQIFARQKKGVPRYSDTYWNGRPQNMAENAERIDEVMLHGAYGCWRYTSAKADALVACLYEYWLCYNVDSFVRKLHYLPLPMILPQNGTEGARRKENGGVVKILVGIQPKRDFMKGAMRMAEWLENIKLRHPGRMEIRYVEGVPLEEYKRMLAEADVLVDQLYSFTPSMNSLQAMALGTVVIGGGEEEYYDFIGEKELRPIINVSPELSDAENMAIIEKALFTDGMIERLSRQSMAFVKKYHDYRKVAEMYEEMYRSSLLI